MEIEETEPLYEPLVQNDVLGDLWCQALADLGYDMDRSAVLGGGSTDMGNVSRRLPSLHPWMSLPGVNIGIHSHDYATAANTDSAYEVMLHGGLAMAWTLAALAESPAEIERLRASAEALRSGADDRAR